MAVAAVLANFVALPAIYHAETNKRRNSAVFLLLLMAYGLAHNLTSTAYSAEPLVPSDSASRYQLTDYSLMLLFLFFSDEFHALHWQNSPRVVLIVLGFVLAGSVHAIALTTQWSRLLDCLGQCCWRYNFYQLIRELQSRAYK